MYVTKSLTYPKYDSAYFVAIGPNHDIYATYRDGRIVTHVGVYRHASMPLHDLGIKEIQQPGDIEIDDGNVLLNDPAARTLSGYPPNHYRRPSTVTRLYAS